MRGWSNPSSFYLPFLCKSPLFCNGLKSSKKMEEGDVGGRKKRKERERETSTPRRLTFEKQTNKIDIPLVSKNRILRRLDL